MKSIVLLFPTMTPLFWLSEHVYWKNGIVNPPTITGLELPQNSVMMVGTLLPRGEQAKITMLSVKVHENSTSEKLIVVLVAVKPSGASGTVCMCVCVCIHNISVVTLSQCSMTQHMQLLLKINEASALTCSRY